MPSQAAPTPEGEAPADHLTGSEDEAAAAFAARGEQAPTDEPTDDSTPADEPADDADPEAEAADPDDAPEAEELAEVEIGGKTYKVAPEVEKAILRQADYSRKMNEVGAKEKAFTERLAAVDALEKSADKRGEALAEVKAIDLRIKAYDGIDWAKAKADNPAEAAMAAIELLSLKDQRREAVQAAANVAREMTDSRNKLLDDARAQMDAALAKSLKGWGDELGTKITKYALDNGMQRKTLEALTDPAVVVALEKARKYDALQSAKATLKAKAQDAAQVVKPGAPRRAPNAQADAMARLRKDNTQESAEAAFLSRMR
jgi:hypothetical protein